MQISSPIIISLGLKDGAGKFNRTDFLPLFSQKIFSKRFKWILENGIDVANVVELENPPQPLDSNSPVWYSGKGDFYLEKLYQRHQSVFLVTEPAQVLRSILTLSCLRVRISSCKRKFKSYPSPNPKIQEFSPFQKLEISNGIIS